MEPWQRQHRRWRFHGVILAAGLRDREHAGWGLCSHRLSHCKQPQAAGPGPVAPFLALTSHPSLPAVLSGVPSSLWAASGNPCLPRVQPAAPSRPHEAPVRPHPISSRQDDRKRSKDGDLRGVDSVQFYLFIFKHFFFSQVCQSLRLERQCRVNCS